MPRHLKLTVGREYIFIDSLYVSDFAEKPALLLTNPDLRKLRTVIFPYPSTGIPYALFTADVEDFDIARIHYFNSDESTADNLLQFCSDTGLILVVDTAVFFEVAAKFNPEVLEDVLEEQPEYLSRAKNWTALVAEYTGALHYFETAEIDKRLAGGGEFRIM
ncbi:hypothetical protein E5K00_18665 [Hymenobacter aquaticus]|uniref:Uncharacterized protein n=1 Tax=Hymenobacter aquaticus TaxID=1867101 RepID=A0A4Z0PWX0_9BACT|nr:hypothetical protein [Hymenobacter aquaticus]TGE22270.1 hypothetical protein E5K00_18665 [Hymenobacter aquaticus]